MFGIFEKFRNLFGIGQILRNLFGIFRFLMNFDNIYITYFTIYQWVNKNIKIHQKRHKKRIIFPLKFRYCKHKYLFFQIFFCLRRIQIIPELIQYTKITHHVVVYRSFKGITDHVRVLFIQKNFGTQSSLCNSFCSSCHLLKLMYVD